MKRSGELNEVLAELRRQHQQLEAPQSLETRLRTAARSKRPVVFAPQWGWAVATALIIGLALWRTNWPSHDVRTSTVERISPSDTTTEFIPLPGTETLPTPVETSILRVRMSKGELRQYGFDVPPPAAAEFVAADFVVGDDGLARAVRLVQ
jgi:hypothetical protein